MKKFLSKKWVMVTLLILSVAMLATYVIVLARPVAIGMSYSGTNTVLGKDYNVTYNFKSCSTVAVTTKGDNTETTVEYWYANKGNQIIIFGPKSTMNKDAFKSEKEATLKNWEDTYLIKDSTGLAYEINAFSLKYDKDTSLTSCGTIVFTVVGLIALGSLVALAYVSVKNQPKSKKKKK